MKKILILLVMLLLPISFASASSISSKAIGTNDISSNPNYAISNGYFYIATLFNHVQVAGNHVYNFNNLSVEGYTDLILSTLFYIETQDSIIQNIMGSECKENGGCWSYQTSVPMFYSQIQMPQIAVLYDNSLWVNCTINNVNYGLQSVSCPVPKGYKKLSSLRIRYNLNFNTTFGGQIITGVGNLINLVYSTEQELIDAVKDDAQSQAQINAINSASQNQINAANTNSQNQINANKANSDAIIKQNVDSTDILRQATYNAADQAHKDSQAQTNATKDQTDFLKDETAPNSDISALGNVTGVFPSGPLDSLLNIPFTFLSVLTSSFSGTCVPMETTWVFGESLTIPCFSEMFWGKVPSAMMTFLDLIPAVFILIQYFKHLYKKVDRAMSMETNSDDEWGVI